MLMRWFVLFMLLLTAIAAAAIITIALVRPKQHMVPKISDYTLVDCSYQRLSDAPTHRGHLSKPHLPHHMEMSLQGRVKSIQSKNMAGYVVAKDLTHPVPKSVTMVSGGWTVPRLFPQNENRYSTASVGIDGYQSKMVIRVGTESDWDSNTEEQINYAWFQVGDTPPMMVVNFPLRVGDTVSASIRRLNSKTGQCQLILRNNTQAAAVVIPSTMSMAPHADFSTAMFVVESPSEKTVLPLADLGSITFHECLCTIDGTLAPIDNESSKRHFAPIHMVNNTEQPILSKTIAHTSTLTPDGKSFAITTSF